MDATELIRAIHASSLRVALVITGCGAALLGHLMAVPGCSQTLLDGQVPYHPEALRAYLSPIPAPTSSVCRITAELMAVRALQRVRAIAAAIPPGTIPLTNLWGISCTGSIATAVPHRGQHRVHITACGPSQNPTIRSISLTFDKTLRGRDGEDAACVRAMLRVLAAAAGLAPWDGPMNPALRPIVASPCVPLGPTDSISLHSVPATVDVHPPFAILPPAPDRTVILSGSFNPLHAGHEQALAAGVAALAAHTAALGRPATRLVPMFELTTANADKGSLAPDVIASRVAAITDKGYMCVVTRCSLFYQRARVLPGAAFVVGYDTAVRILDPKYYIGFASGRPCGPEDDITSADAAPVADGAVGDMGDASPEDGGDGVKRMLGELRGAGVTLIVVGRAHEGSFLTLRDLSVPAGYEDMFVEVPEAAFRSVVVGAVVAHPRCWVRVCVCT